MKRQAPPHLSDEKLNAFIDDELDFEEKEQVFRQLKQDDLLNREIHELHQVGDLLRHAYRNPPPAPQHRSRAEKKATGLFRAAASIGLLALGALAGWYGNERFTSEAAQVLAIQPNSVTRHAVATETSNLLLHINSSDAGKMEALLDYAEQSLAEHQRQNRRFRLEVVANDGGINMLRRDTSPFPRRIETLLNDYPNVSFNACANALRRLREQGEKIELIPGIRQDHSAIDKITNRIEQGWRYLKV